METKKFDKLPSEITEKSWYPIVKIVAIIALLVVLAIFLTKILHWAFACVCTLVILAILLKIVHNFWPDVLSLGNTFAMTIQ